MPELGLETQETFSRCISTNIFFWKLASKLKQYQLKVKI